jgi:hypothetical protein
MHELFFQSRRRRWCLSDDDACRSTHIHLYCPFNPYFAITATENMTLCDVCAELDPQSTQDEEARLGEYDEICKRALAGCEGCDFFRTILRNSHDWNHRLDELPGHIVFLDSQRLDVRAPDEVDVHTYSCDDLLFDVCTPEGVVGTYSDWQLPFWEVGLRC